MSIRRKEQTSSSAIKNLIQQLGIEEKLITLEVEKLWHETMGAHISKHTQRIFIEKQTLFIQLDSAVLRNELSLIQSKLLTKINENIDQKLFNKLKFI